MTFSISCDLLKNSYLCLLNNTNAHAVYLARGVVICWKIRIFAYWTTPRFAQRGRSELLWFAEKFVSLLIEQHQSPYAARAGAGCDLLKNSYLCLLNNTEQGRQRSCREVVICWKIRIFAYWTTPALAAISSIMQLWFAEKFVSLLIEQHPVAQLRGWRIGCDLLKNSYLCLLNNTLKEKEKSNQKVVICWKIRIFAYWTTPRACRSDAGWGCDLLKNSYLCLLNNTSRSVGALPM